jgi:hypothetical protein
MASLRFAPLGHSSASLRTPSGGPHAPTSILEVLTTKTSTTGVQKQSTVKGAEATHCKPTLTQGPPRRKALVEVVAASTPVRGVRLLGSTPSPFPSPPSPPPHPYPTPGSSPSLSPTPHPHPPHRPSHRTHTIPYHALHHTNWRLLTIGTNLQVAWHHANQAETIQTWYGTVRGPFDDGGPAFVKYVGQRGLHLFPPKNPNIIIDEVRWWRGGEHRRSTESRAQRKQQQKERQQRGRRDRTQKKMLHQGRSRNNTRRPTTNTPSPQATQEANHPLPRMP